VTREQLFAEIDDVIRTMPARDTMREQSNVNSAWFGRAFAAISKWNPMQGPIANYYRDQFFAADPGREIGTGLTKFVTLLHQAHNALRIETAGPATLVVPHKMVFEYFDELRKIVELARHDLLFVDPYLEAEFVSSYLPNVQLGVVIRLLAREKMATLCPAVEAYAQQSGATIKIRKADHFHDRYVFVDRASCYQSSASFKDGAKSAPTTITQITDARVAVLQMYEDIWANAKIVR
jgi:hypothetical protein